MDARLLSAVPELHRSSKHYSPTACSGSVRIVQGPLMEIPTCCHWNSSFQNACSHVVSKSLLCCRRSITHSARKQMHDGYLARCHISMGKCAHGAVECCSTGHWAPSIAEKATSAQIPNPATQKRLRPTSSFQASTLPLPMEVVRSITHIECLKSAPASCIWSARAH